MSATQFKIWLQTHPNPRFRSLFTLLKRVRSAGLPTPQWLNKLMYSIYQIVSMFWQTFLRVAFFTPTFKGRLAQFGSGLYLYGGIPLVTGPLSIKLGDHCRVSGQTTFSGRVQTEQPRLIIGNNVDIGWQNTIAVGSQVIIEDNVRIASGAFIFGYSGHSLDAQLRAEGMPDEESNIGDILIKRDAWLGTNVTVRPNVTIGQGTIVAAGSVVTRDLPDFVVAAGNPAKVVRQLKEQTHA
ncbi:DapH/DapD/GlmU-related protein [Vibrio sp. LaRot3]|uniref:DapH/DapD/GlmU-related protein n=1 Tax=Vibrio sp. LaRot3 TaxID=2998829 RepID=UPI0022CDDA0E|nr:DapH/DapD/GlmU-related protein [Vibrio sp. LaRot3]MDA0147612.1 DapH/DapD/GlmU-related protein [Vibrio sp. LaRot3]